MELTAIDHVGIAVHDLDAAVADHVRLYGARVTHTEQLPAQGVREALLAVGDGFIQLLEPTRDDAAVARFLARRGEGLHHVAYRVPDVEAALARLAQRGARLVDTAPRAGSRGTRIAFVHPATAAGTLVELVEAPDPDPTAAPDPHPGPSAR